MKHEIVPDAHFVAAALKFRTLKKIRFDDDHFDVDDLAAFYRRDRQT